MTNPVPVPTVSPDLERLRAEQLDLTTDLGQFEELREKHATELERLRESKAPVSDRVSVQEKIVAVESLIAVLNAGILEIKPALDALETEFEQAEHLHAAAKCLLEIQAVVEEFELLEAQVKEFAKTLEPTILALLERWQNAQGAYFGIARQFGSGKPMDRFDNLESEISLFGFSQTVELARCRLPSMENTVIGSALVNVQPGWVTGFYGTRPHAEIVAIATQAALEKQAK